MNKLIDFLKSIHVSEAIIADLTAENDAKTVNIPEIASAYLTSRDAFYESSKLKDKLVEQEASTAKGMTLKAIKKMNELLGMGYPNSKMEEYKTIEEFLTEAKTFKADYEDKLKSSSSKSLADEIDKWKTLATERQNSLDKMTVEKDEFFKRVETEKNEAIQMFQAKDNWKKMIMADAEIADVPGKEFILDAIEERIFSMYKVTAEGKLFKKDGTIATHPEKDITISTLAEVYPYFKEKAGLMKVNNAGETPNNATVYKSPDGKSIAGEGFSKAALEFLQHN